MPTNLNHATGLIYDAASTHRNGFLQSVLLELAENEFAAQGRDDLAIAAQRLRHTHASTDALWSFWDQLRTSET